MVITAVNNIYEMCINQMHKNKNKKTSNVTGKTNNSEMDSKLMKALTSSKLLFLLCKFLVHSLLLTNFIILFSLENLSKDKTSENSVLLQNFLKKLETIGETIEDLKEVAKLVPEYNKESIIAEEAAGGVITFNK